MGRILNVDLSSSCFESLLEYHNIHRYVGRNLFYFLSSFDVSVLTDIIKLCLSKTSRYCKTYYCYNEGKIKLPVYCNRSFPCELLLLVLLYQRSGLVLYYYGLIVSLKSTYLVCYLFMYLWRNNE